MNLHALVHGQIGAVNSNVPLVVRVSTGVLTTNDAFERVPGYATPGAIVASFSAYDMVVSAVSSGALHVGQTLAGLGLLPGTRIERQVSGTPGGAGAYKLNLPQELLTDLAVATSYVVAGQVQPMGWKDLQLIDGLNVQGQMNKIYFFGQVEAIVRPDRQGGDLVTDPAGRVWLVTNVLEDWSYSGWCAVVGTLQNGA